MTLIIAMANREQAILVSDRRLTANSRLVDDDSNKAAGIILADARLGAAFTGLAQAPGFTTNRWLCKVLTELAAPEHRMEPLLERFAARAERDFSGITGNWDKRLTVGFVGYSYDCDPPRPWLWRVSNFEGGPDDQAGSQAGTQFTTLYWRGRHPPPDRVCLLRAFGGTNAISSGDMDALHHLLHALKPARALVGKAVEVIQAASRSPKARGTIGTRITSVVVPSNPARPGYTEYHTDQVLHQSGGVVFIEARGGVHGSWFLEVDSVGTLDASGNPAISAVPKVGRNQPCPCGSGEKYKRCHGKHGSSEILSISDGAWIVK